MWHNVRLPNQSERLAGSERTPYATGRAKAHNELATNEPVRENLTGPSADIRSRYEERIAATTMDVSTAVDIIYLVV